MLRPLIFVLGVTKKNGSAQSLLCGGTLESDTLRLQAVVQWSPLSKSIGRVGSSFPSLQFQARALSSGDIPQTQLPPPDKSSSPSR